MADPQPVDDGMSQRAPPPLFDLTKSMDARLVPEASAYCAPMGAAAISSVEVILNQQNINTHTFPVTPPSAGCVIQRSPVYRVEGYITFTAGGFQPIKPATLVANAAYNGQAPLNTPFPRLGVDMAIAPANPLNLLVNNWQVNINNATSQYNNTGVRDIQQSLTNPKRRAGRGVTYRSPLYARWDDAVGTSSSLGSVADLQGDGDIPPGAYELEWAVPDGVTTWYSSATGLAGSWTANAASKTAGVSLKAVADANPTLFMAYDTGVAIVGPTSPTISWVGVTTAMSSGIVAVGVKNLGGIGLPYVLYNTVICPAPVPATSLTGGLRTYALLFVMIDTVQCPPFGFDFDHSYREQGLWGATSMLITAQLGSPGSDSARWLQGTRRGGLSSLNYVKWTCVKASLWFQYLSPDNSAASILPPRCVLPLMYKQNTTFAYGPICAAGNKISISVPSYTFSQVADAMFISARPTASGGEWMPEFVADSPNGVCTSMVPFYEADVCGILPDRAFSQFQYSNITGILSNMSAQQAVAMSRKNGVEASVAQYGGITGSGQMINAGVQTSMAGAVLVVRPGTDFPLPVGVTPGSMGNIQIQYTLEVLNQCDRSVTYTVSTTCVSTGFFVLDNGAARMVLVGIVASALEKASMDMDSFATNKLVGGGFMSTLGAWAGKAWKHRKHIMNVANAARGAYNAYKGDKGGMMGVAGAGLDSSSGTKRVRGSLLAALDQY